MPIIFDNNFFSITGIQLATWSKIKKVLEMSIVFSSLTYHSLYYSDAAVLVEQVKMSSKGE